jgi:hypothetical protein
MISQFFIPELARRLIRLMFRPTLESPIKEKHRLAILSEEGVQL